jgi:hypothetical protein
MHSCLCSDYRSWAQQRYHQIRQEIEMSNLEEENRRLREKQIKLQAQLTANAEMFAYLASMNR